MIHTDSGLHFKVLEILYKQNTIPTFAKRNEKSGGVSKHIQV